MKATRQLKQQLMKKYGWTSIRRDKTGKWYGRHKATRDSGWRRFWTVYPIWDDGEIKQMVDEGIISI